MQSPTSTSTLVVHVLRESQRPLAALFGSLSGDRFDEFDHCSWVPGPGGSPVLVDTDWFAGRAITSLDVGDHTAILLDVFTEGSSQRSDEGQLGYEQVRAVEPGHAP